MLGPISVTVHIPVPSLPSFSSSSSAFTLASLPPSHHSVRTLRELHALYRSSPIFSEYVDVHLALSPFASLVQTSSRATATPSTSTAPGVVAEVSDVPHAAPGSGSDRQSGSNWQQAQDLDSPGSGGRQFNVWRNVARLFARTALVMMLDVDFAVCTDFRGDLREAFRRAGLSGSRNADDEKQEKRIHERGVRRIGRIGKHDQDAEDNMTKNVDVGDVLQEVKDGRAVLVVPAFEYVKQEDGLDQWTFPTDKEVCLSGKLSVNVYLT